MSCGNPFPQLILCHALAYVLIYDPPFESSHCTTTKVGYNCPSASAAKIRV